MKKKRKDSTQISWSDYVMKHDSKTTHWGSETGECGDFWKEGDWTSNPISPM
jgi:hypothetical protein